MKYLARYVRGTPIGNSRLVSDALQQVTFTFKDYRDAGKRKEFTLTGEEFVARLLLHILPYRFSRVRHKGCLAGPKQKETLAAIRAQLGWRKGMKLRRQHPSRSRRTSLPVTPTPRPTTLCSNSARRGAASAGRSG